MRFHLKRPLFLKRPLLLGATLLSLTWTLATTLGADAPPPVSEQALLRLLEGDTSGAIRLLEAGAAGTDGDPSLRWLAARVALESKDLKTARRLLEGDSGAVAWTQVDLLLAEGRADEAAQEALRRMEDALKGTHRDALALKLLEWARARLEKDPATAQALLGTAWSLASSEATQLQIEARYFPLLDDDIPPQIRDVVEERLQKHPDHMAARMLKAQVLSDEGGTRRLDTLLEPVLQKGEKPLAMQAGRLLLTERLPPTLLSRLLDGLRARFPGDDEVGKLLMVHAEMLSQADPSAGERRLEALSLDPILRRQALMAWAALSPNPAERRARWLKLAALEGASDLGTSARQKATEALLASVLATKEGPARAKAATDALLQPDASSHPELKYYSLAPAIDAPSRLKRLEALWDFLEKYPAGGVWCDELAQELTQQETPPELARKFRTGCRSATLPEAQALQALDAETPYFYLRPGAGKAELLSTGAETVDVTEHDLDPLTLFRATTGSPLNASLNAYLTAPDRRFSLQVPADRIVRRSLAVTGKAPLVAMTVRAGSLRSTLLVAQAELEVQTAAQGTETAYLVLKDNLPVANATLTWRSSSGQELTSKTDGSGLGQVKLPVGEVRVLAQSGSALGYACLTVQADAPDPSALKLVLADRAYPEAGARGSVAIVSTRLSQAVPEKLKLVSLSKRGNMLEEQPVTLKNGWARADLLLQGGGSLQLKHETRVLDSTGSLPLAEAFADRDRWSNPFTPALPDDLAFSVTPAEPEEGQKVSLVAWRLGHQSPDTPPLQLEVRLGGKHWNAQAQDAKSPAVLELTVPAEPGGAALEVRIRTQVAQPDPTGMLTEHSAAEAAAPAEFSRRIPLRAPEVTSPILPSLVKAGEALSSTILEDAWWTLSTPEQPSSWRWIPPGSPLVLPGPGIWQVAPWRNGIVGRTQSIMGLDAQGPVQQDGKLVDTRPTLWVQSDQHIRRVRLGGPGTLLELSPASDVQRSYWTPARPDLKPIVLLPQPLPSVQVGGSLTRVGTSTLELGSGLPPGTRVWAWLTDASNGRKDGNLPDLTLPTPRAGLLGVTSERTSTSGSLIEGALLQEEELAKEELEAQLDLDDALPAELAASASFNMGGIGGGGSGYGRAAGLGRGPRSQIRAPLPLRSEQGTWPQALAVLENASPGRWNVTVPESTTQVQLRLLARLPSGALVGSSSLLPVGGPTPARPSLPPLQALDDNTATAWDGSFPGLLRQARTLPLGARALALTALEQQGHAELKIERLGVSEALNHRSREQSLSDREAAGHRLTAFLLHEAPSSGSENAEALTLLPDARLTERAHAALNAASADPERAAAASRRILEAPELPLSARIRASLALWLTGHAEDARAGVSGTDPLLQATQLLITPESSASSALTPEATAELLRVAGAPLAEPLERAVALQALAKRSSPPVTPAPAQPSKTTLSLSLYAPLATLKGQVLSRGFWGGNQDGPPILMKTLEAPAGRWVPVTTVVGPSRESSRLVCPYGQGLHSSPQVHELDPLLNQTTLECRVWVAEEGKHTLNLHWLDPRGQALASGSTVLTSTPARGSSPEDPMSSSERLELAIRLGEAGDAAAIPLLKRLLGMAWIPEQEVERASRALFAATLRAEDPEALVSAFEGFRERANNAELPLAAAARLARALAKTNKPARAVAAARLVLDSRLQEELQAVSVLQEGSLRLTAVSLVKLLLKEYPEVPTAKEARYLAASSLLELSDASEPPVGASRTALRKTGAEQLARFLLLEKTGERSAEAAALLLDTLQMLREPAREEGLAGPLAKRFAQSPLAWRMVVSSARAQVARGRFADAVRSLEGLQDADEGQNEVALTLGRALEGLGKTEEALEQYRKGGAGEAAARRAYLTRSSLETPAVLVFGAKDPLVLKGWLPPGTPVKVLAYQISLEDLLLRDGGAVNPEEVRVDGLRPAASLERRVGREGDLVLPGLKEGAYLLSITFGSSTRRILALRTELELWVQPGSAQGGRSLALATTAGSGIADASIWVWQTSGEVERLRTDIQGHGYSTSPTVRTVLARRQDSYALWQPRDAQPEPPSEQEEQYDDSPAPAQSQMRSRLLQKSNQDWNGLFENRSQSQVRASEL